jgi:DNA repair protein RadC
MIWKRNVTHCPVSDIPVDGDRIRHLEGRSAGTGYGRYPDSHGLDGSGSSPLHTGPLCDGRHRSSYDRSLCGGIDDLAGHSGAQVLADGGCRPSDTSTSGAFQPGAGSEHASDRVSDDAGCLILASPAASGPRNLATSAAPATQRQRSILADFIEIIEPVDGDQLANALFDEFRSLGRIFAQSPQSLERVLGGHAAVARILLGSRLVLLEGMREEFASLPISPDCPNLLQYLMASMGALPDEVLRVIFLDSAGHLIADEQLQVGSLRQLALYPRAIFRRAMELDAAGLILVHNHPSGNPNPSESDIAVTQTLSEIGRSLDIDIVDHIVVTATRTMRVSSLNMFQPHRPTESSHVIKDSVGPKAGYPYDRGPAALENARAVRERRKFRSALIGSPELFGEPSWEMLIEVFIQEAEGVKIAVNTLCRSSTATPSTALRIFNKLCEARLLVKVSDPNDGRRHFVQLTLRARKSLYAYFCVEKN